MAGARSRPLQEFQPPLAVTYGSFNNRLMSYKVEQDATVLEETWYAYNFGGQIRRIVTEYPQTQADYYFVRVLQYNVNQQLWLIRGYENMDIPGS